MNNLTHPLSTPESKVTLNLSVEALDYLSGTTGDNSHFAILRQLITSTSTSPTTTTKRGNVIPLKSGQVECSIHSFCQSMSLGRKAMERIIHDFERLAIIRLHRSRLATIADMICIAAWQIDDDTVIPNPILTDLSDPHTDEQTDQTDATL